MDYTKIYNNLIESRRLRVLPKEFYYENHHINPKCVTGDDSKLNRIDLTADEHYLAHYLLVKIYKNTEYYPALLCAFRFMTVGHDGHRNRAKDYAWMREQYSKFHPMKNTDIAIKTSKGLINYYINETEEQKKERIMNITKSLKLYFNNITDEDRLKICERSKMQNNKPEVKLKLSNSLKAYYASETFEHKQIRLDILRKTSLSPESNIKRSKSLKAHISGMDTSELLERMRKSFGSCDHVERGKSISKSKKGVKTNQQEIVGKRYASMTDLDFNEMLKTKSPRMHKRLTNLRLRFINV